MTALFSSITYLTIGSVITPYALRTSDTDNAKSLLPSAVATLSLTNLLILQHYTHGKAVSSVYGVIPCLRGIAPTLVIALKDNIMKSKLSIIIEDIIVYTTILVGVVYLLSN